MTMVFTFSKEWICIKGVDFLKGHDLIDVMLWVQGHNFQDFHMKVGDCADGYRLEVEMDI